MPARESKSGCSGCWWKGILLVVAPLATICVVHKGLQRNFPNLPWASLPNIPFFDGWKTTTEGGPGNRASNGMEDVWNVMAKGVASKSRTLSLPELSEKYHRAVYKIDVLDSDGSTIGTGTGFAVSDDGLIITNNHVASAGKHLMVVQEGNRLPVQKILAYQETNDLALLQIKEKTPDYVELVPDGENTPAGTPIAVIGGPLGLAGSLSDGIVASYRDLKEYGVTGSYLQITAPISHGSSGSPVFRMDGKVIGVATANLYGGQQLNFAVPSSRVVGLLNERKTEKKVTSMAYSEEPLTGDDPIFENVEFRKARLLWVHGSYENAREKFEPLLAQFPNSAALLTHLADCLAHRGDVPRALGYFKTASKLVPKDTLLWERYGYTLEQGGYNAQAVQAFEYLLTLDQDRAEISAKLGKLYADLGNNPKAIDAYKKALNGSGKTRDWSVELARLYVAQQEWAKAYAAMEPFLEGNREMPTGKDLALLHLARRCRVEQGLSTTDIDSRIEVAGKVNAIASIQADPGRYGIGVQPRPQSQPTQKSAIPEALFVIWSIEKVSLTFGRTGMVHGTIGSNFLDGTYSLTGERSGNMAFKNGSNGTFQLIGNDTLSVTLPRQGGGHTSYTLKH